MNKKQTSRFKMYQGTIDFSVKNAEITATLPNFDTNLTNLKLVGDAIHLIAQIQSGDSSGITIVKNTDRDTLIELTSDSIRKIAAFAKLTKNQLLLKDVDYSESDLKRLPDITLPDTAKLIYDRVQENITELAAYQISGRSQDRFLEAINSFRQTASTPRAGIISQVQVNKQLATLFKNGDQILVEMDTVVEIIRKSHPEFYAGYKLARKVIETSSSKRTIRGLITDEESLQPIAGVKVSIWPDGVAMKTMATGEALVTKKSAAKGGFYVNSLAAGTYKVVLQKTGYTEQTVTIFVNEGEQTKVDVKLAKA